MAFAGGKPNVSMAGEGEAGVADGWYCVAIRSFDVETQLTPLLSLRVSGTLHGLEWLWRGEVTGG